MGSIIVLAIVAVVVSIVFSLVILSLKKADSNSRQISVLDIAEAGINYYLWHLAHDPTDYKDGNSTPVSSPFGPYPHNYTDSSGKVIGSYTLYITPPPLGSNRVKVESKGVINGGNENRTIVAELGIPSFAAYGFLSHSEAWFGSSESTDGPAHSNTGMHFDGIGNDIISSANATYTPTSSFGGDGSVHNGVWGNGGPQNFWVYPVPSINFTSITANFNSLRTQAAPANGGILLDTITSGGIGYYLNLKNNSTIDVWKVTGESSTGITKSFVNNRAAPANGILYSDYNVWVDGTWNGKMTIVAAKLPDVSSTNRSIKIINNLLYTAKNGTVNVGLITQRNISVARYAPTTLEIDAAMLVQKGHIWWPYINGVIKTTITVYGSIATYDYWTWTWVNGSGTVVSGYQTTQTTYDRNLTLAAPPGFPLTGSYAILSYKEKD